MKSGRLPATALSLLGAILVIYALAVALPTLVQRLIHDGPLDHQESYTLFAVDRINNDEPIYS